MADGKGKFKLGGMEGKLTIVGDIMSPVVGPEVWEVLRDEPPAEALLDPESPPALPHSRKSRRRPRKPR